MTDVTVVGDLLRFPERDAELPDPVWELFAGEDLVLAVVEPHDGRNRNVHAFEPDGTRRWQIESPSRPELDGDPYFGGAWVADSDAWARSGQVTFRVDAETGAMRERFPATEVPVGDTTVSIPYPAKRFLSLDDGKAILYDRRPADDGGFEYPPNRNVVAYGADGTERWRIDEIEVPAGSVRRPFDDEQPWRFGPIGGYDDLRRENGDLVVETMYYEARVDPGDGSVALRGPSAGASTVALGPETVVGLPSSVSRWHLTERDDRVLVLLEPDTASPPWDERNVVALDSDGNAAWRIDETPGNGSDTFEGIWEIGDRVLVRARDATYELDIETGALTAQYAATELPVGDEVVQFPLEVGFATEREGVVVVFLDVYRSDADTDVPGNQCVFGHDESGERLWQIDPLPEGDIFTNVFEDGDQIRTAPYNSPEHHVDWRTGDLRLATRNPRG